MYRDSKMHSAIEIAVRDFKPNNIGPEKLRSDNDSEVVVQYSCTDMQPGCETSLLFKYPVIGFLIQYLKRLTSPSTFTCHVDEI